MKVPGRPQAVTSHSPSGVRPLSAMHSPGYNALLASHDDVRALARKYDEISRLRRAAAASPDVDPRREMAALAAEFPGALREADDFQPAELDRRVTELARVFRTGDAPAAWMTMVARFHRLTRGALCAKKWLDGRKVVDAAVAQAFEGRVRHALLRRRRRGVAPELAVIANPPRGRLTEVIFERIAGEVGQEVETVRRVVFGEPRRPR